MERLITVKDMKERYGCSLPTARKLLRQITPHMENPLTTYGWALQAWEESRTVIPPETSRKRREEIIQKQKAGKVHVPRHR